MKAAIVHDWLTGMRGGERCLEIFCEIFPEADLFTLLHLPGRLSPIIEERAIKTSFIQNLPFAKSAYRKYLPFFPMAIERFDLKGYDLVLSCSHCVAKGVISSPDSIHICYLLTPMRYAWDMYGDYFGKNGSRTLPFFIHYLRMWDVTSSQRVDHFLCISRHVEKRVRKFYRREAEVIHPPVETRRFRIEAEKEDFFLMVSSLVPYKRIDLAVEAFNRLRYPLKIIGSGPEEERLHAMAKSNIQFLGWQPDGIVSNYYSKCRALIFPGEEDFGIVPLEAMASGSPVIAFGRGGAVETVVPCDSRVDGPKTSPTGLFFHEPSADALIQSVEWFRQKEREFDPRTIRNHALRWDTNVFKDRIRKKIFELTGHRC